MKYKDTKYIEQFPRNIVGIIEHIYHYKYIQIRKDTPSYFFTILLQLEQLGILGSYFDDNDTRIFYDRENMVRDLWLYRFNKLQNNEFFVEDEIKEHGRLK